MTARALSSVAPVTQVLPASSGPITFSNAAVGGGKSTVDVQLLINQIGTLTIGAPVSANGHAEFTPGAVTGCAVDGTTTVAAGSICSFTVTFSPYYPGQRSQPLTVTLGGQVYTFGLTGYATGPLVHIDPSYTYTVVGRSGTSTLSPVFGVPASQGILYLSRNIFVDASDNVYIADTGYDYVDVVYQTANPQLACLIITETPALFGASGTKGCADATSQPIVGYIYNLAGVGTTGTTIATNTLATSGKVIPLSVFVDAFGNIFLPDSGSRIRVIFQGGASMACLIQIENPTVFGLATGAMSCAGATSQPTPGYIYNIIGNGTGGNTGDGGLAASAEVINPSDVFVDTDGDIYFSSFGAAAPTSGRIRIIYNGGPLAAQLITLENLTVTAPTTGYVYTIAGNAATSDGDGGLATATGAGVQASYGVRVDKYGNVYFSDKTYGTVTSTSTMPLAVARVRVIYNGTAANPNPLAALIAATNPGVTAQPGYMYTIAGSTAGGVLPGGTVEEGVVATSSHFVGPYQIALDAAGDILVADELNQTIRRISASTGYITTILGKPNVKAVVNGTGSELYSPWGMALSSAGDVYFVDDGAYRLRAAVAMDSPQAAASVAAGGATDRFTVPSGAANAVSGVYGFIETNIGTPGSSLVITTDNASSDNNPTASFGFLSPAKTWAGINECQPALPTSLTVPSITSNISLASGASCQIGVAATATSAGTYTGSVTTTDNSLLSAGSVHTMYASVVETGVAITVTTNPVSLYAGNAAQITATLVNGTTPVTSGTVAFSITGNSTPFGSAALDSAGTATVTLPAQSAGTVSITVSYPGATGVNALFVPATSVSTLTVASKPVPTITITASPTSITAGASTTLTAHVSSTLATPTGTLNIIAKVGTTTTTVCSTTTLAASGTFSCSVSTLGAGTNAITAAYMGDANFGAYSSPTPATVVVAALPSTTQLTVTPSLANLNQQVQLTATVSGMQPGLNYSGGVTFSDSFTPVGGSTTTVLTYGPVAVDATTGVATYSSSTLAIGTHVIKATFANDTYYASSTAAASASVIVTGPAFVVTPTAPVEDIIGSASTGYSVGIAIPQGSKATITFSVQSMGGYAGTVTPSCNLAGLPAGFYCVASPASTVFTGANNTVSTGVVIYTQSQSSLNRMTLPLLAAFGFPGIGLALFGLRRKAMQTWMRLVLVAIVLAGALGVTSLSGCSGTSLPTAPKGTYSMPITFTDGTTSYTMPVTISVQGTSSQ
ncbi:MAG TPA: Ig-like domain repeat protein [Acidobacteriaceae bacterium]